MQQQRLINNSSQLNMFRAIILPIFRSTRLRVTACSIMHPRCCWPVAWKRRDSVPPLPGYRPGCSILILHASCQKTCMTYTIAVYTVKNFWRWTEELSETCRVSFQNKFGKSVHLIGFIIRNVFWSRSVSDMLWKTLSLLSHLWRVYPRKRFLVTTA